MEKKLTNSGPLREPADKHSIYTIKKAADTAQICYPPNATLGKDTGFQGYEPAGVLTRQPKKNRKARSYVWRTGSSIISSPAPVWL